MSQWSGIGKQIAAAAIRDFVPYCAASFAAACAVVVCAWASEAWQGNAFAVDELPEIVSFATIITLIYALPASAILIGVSEWRGYGPRYLVGAGVMAALISYGGLVLLIPGGNPPATNFVLVAIGGAIGGYAFWRVRKLLVDWLGNMACPSVE